MKEQSLQGKTAIKAGKGCLLVVLLFIVLMAAMAALDGWNRYKDGKASAQWPTTEGVILTSELKTDLGKSDDVDPKYTAAITYRYAVEGYEYTGERVSFAGRTFLEKVKAESLVTRYNKGKRVRVSYDPQTPHVSALEPGNASGLPVFSVVLVLAIVFFLLQQVRAYLRKKQTAVPYSPVSPTPQEPPFGSTNNTTSTSAPLPGAEARSSKGLGILTLAMFAAGIFLMAWGGNELKRAYESRSWPNTPGTITSAYIQKSHHRSSEGHSTTSYTPKVGYRYIVEGKIYTCDRIAFGGKSGGKRSKAKAVVDEYPSGRQVTVYYNPRDPKIAVLKAGFSWGAILVALAGVVFFGVGILCYKGYQSNKQGT